jgi:DNA-binding transcriptional LysR family regulator
MELEDLRIFLAVVRRGTLTGASGETHLSQPAITRRLQRLQAELGARLFEREGRGLRLTAAGARFQERAEAILGEVAELPVEMALFAEGTRGRLRVGATVTSCLYLLPPVFRAFRATYPEVQVIVRNDTSRRMGELVEERRIDVGVASTLAPREGVRALPWRNLELALVGPPASGRQPAAPGDLSRYPMVLPSGGTLRTLTEAVFARWGVAPPVVAECDSLEVVKTLVAGGFGLAILPRICLAPGEGELAEVPLPEPLAELPVAVLVPRGPSLPLPVARFLEVLGLGS